MNTHKEQLTYKTSPPHDTIDSNTFNGECKDTGLINISDFFEGKDLTEGQINLIQELEMFLLDDEQSIFIIKGYAGVGKTFITSGLTKYLTSINRQFALLASTGKASKVIAGKTQCEASTIHRYIAYSPQL